MNVNVGGQEYEIDGFLMGRGPVWWLLSKGGNKMTGEQFESLPEEDKRKLYELVKSYISDINSGRSPT